MQIKNTITNLKQVINESERLGKWESWYKNYYQVYSEIFDYMLNNLYRADINIYKQFIENSDFESWKQIIKNFERSNLEENISCEVNRVAEHLGYEEDFDVYIMVGFGHVNGTAGLLNKPFCYFGIESISDLREIKNLIPHEMNHMIRNSMVTKSKSIDRMKFGELLISEGLGTVYPLILDDNLNEKSLADSTLKNYEKYKRMNSRNDALITEVLKLMNEELNERLFNDHFRIDNSTNDDLSGKGYYVGGQIIRELIENGEKIKDLTFMESTEILEKYMKLSSHRLTRCLQHHI